MRFSIVTPTRNSERFLAQTVESVLSQAGDFEIQYLIVDAQSTDRTSDVAAKYQLLLEQGKLGRQCRKVEMQFFSEPDDSMYEAINRGFSRSDGDVMAWINSDDLYLPGAFAAVAEAMSDHRRVAWIKGITSYVNELSEKTQAGSCYLYDQKWIQAGVYGPLFNFIQQDSVFWRSSLWERSGGIDTSLRLSGDYFLWCNFARFEPLFSLPRPVSCFRQHGAQLSSDIDGYWREAASKRKIPGFTKHRFLGRLLNSAALAKRLRLSIRRARLGSPHYRYVPRRSFQSVATEKDIGSDVICDLVTSAVLL